MDLNEDDVGVLTPLVFHTVLQNLCPALKTPETGSLPSQRRAASFLLSLEPGPGFKITSDL